MQRHETKTAVITGAGSGIGRAVALAWAAAGGGGYLLGRNMQQLEQVAEAMRANVVPVRCLQLDLEEKDAILTICRILSAEEPRLDLLVHSAGAVAFGKIEELGVEELERQYRVNLRAPYLLTQQLLPLLRKAQGQVVFINSSAGLSARGGFAPYVATKHALKGLADSLRQEVNVDGIRVISVYPGRTASPMQLAVCRMEGRPYHPENLLQPEDVAAAVMNAIDQSPCAEITDLQLRPLRKN